MNSFKKSINILFKLTILLALLAGCQTPTATTVPSATDTAAPSPTDTIAPSPTDTLSPAPELNGLNLKCDEKAKAGEVETTPFYVIGQVILTGPTGAIDELVNQLKGRNITLDPLTVCTIEIPQVIPWLDKPTEGFKKTVPPDTGAELPHITGKSLAVSLYRFDATKVSFLEILKAMNNLQDGKQPSDIVYADPNYLTGNLSKSACGSPFGVEGSPFGVEGSPFGVEGSPNGGAGLPAQTDAFWGQWAFTNIHLELPKNRSSGSTGAGVRVGLFDTSPYPPVALGTTAIRTELLISPALEIVLHQRVNLPNLVSTGTPPVDISGHGLFVSSLIHALALQSELHLYPVLNASGCGDLYTLNISILDFVTTGLKVTGLAQPGVINLSLGVAKPRLTGASSAALAAYGQNIQQAYAQVTAQNTIESLALITYLAYRAGIVVIAAAGNDSVLQSLLLPMELPAAYPFVLGVSAVDRNSAPACYSNQGDVAAPGGAAVNGTAPAPNPAGQPVPICVPKAVDCPAIETSASPASLGQCEYGLVGLYSNLQTPQPQFAYWSGTSFATPLVSGMAAIDYQTGLSAKKPDDIYRDILVSVNRAIPNFPAVYGSGVIVLP
jgi:hypothetical protein